MLYDPKWEVKIDTDIVRILRSAKRMISDPRHWTCGEYARTARGNPIGVECAAAVSFCSIGALALASGLSVKAAEDSPACGFLDAAAKEKNYCWVHSLNDGGGHEMAMAMFDRAIELAHSVVSSAHRAPT